MQVAYDIVNYVWPEFILILEQSMILLQKPN